MGKKGISIISRGIRYKLKIAFYLMSILPLLVSIYLVLSYFFPLPGIRLHVGLTIIINVLVSISGFFVIKGIVDRILKLSKEAKLIAAGDLSRRVSTEKQDEVDDLGEALNQLTSTIRANMNELQQYSEKTEVINVEIQKRVFVLSSVLQISSLISQGGGREEIFRAMLGKSKLLASSDAAYLLTKDEEKSVFTTQMINSEEAERLVEITGRLEDKIFGDVIHHHKSLIIDRDNVLPEELASVFYNAFKLKNTLAFPVSLRGKIVAVLGIGNKLQEFCYKKEDKELLDIFAKQLAIYLENECLSHRLRKLETKDALTGLYNETFILGRLQEEIRRSIVYQRPCAFILFNIDNFQSYYNAFGLLQAESALKKVASLIGESVSEIDLVGRVGDNEFGIVLPEKNKRKAQNIADEIRKKIERVFSDEPEGEKRITISAGISENPLDGVNADELMMKARQALNAAKQQGRSRVL